MAEVIVEIIDRNGVAVSRHCFNALPIRIGRGYGNDLIVPDPYVCAEHLRIDRDATGFLVEDLGSKNGTRAHGRQIQDQRTYLASGEFVGIGGTRLRILAPSHPVPPALSLGFWSRPGGRAIFRILTWASLLPMMGVLLLDEYFSSFAKVQPAKLLKEVIPPMLLALVWAGFWSLIGYSAKRQTRFHAQLLIASAFVVVVPVVDKVITHVSFATNLGWVQTGGIITSCSLLFGLLVYINLGLATETARNRRAIASSIVALGVILVATITHFAGKPDFESKPNVLTTLKPLYVKLAPSLTPRDFLQKSRETFERSRRKNPQQAATETSAKPSRDSQ